MKIRSHSVLLCILVYALSSFPVEIHSVTKSGRMVQLDGFLLEWNKDNAGALGTNSPWVWDALNTKEGLTGYFKTSRLPQCRTWTFRFLPHRLSPYMRLDMTIGPEAAQSFYRISRQESGKDSTIVAEWVIPWSDILMDSLGAYQVGLMAWDSCGDTMQPIIFSGHSYRNGGASWGKVYSKAVLLVVLLAFLLYLQKISKKKARVKRKKDKEPFQR